MQTGQLSDELARRGDLSERIECFFGTFNVARAILVAQPVVPDLCLRGWDTASLRETRWPDAVRSRLNSTAGPVRGLSIDSAPGEKKKDRLRM